KAGCDITGFMSLDRPLNDAELAAALDWYRAVGVDLAVGEEPVDRFAASSAAPRRSTPIPPPVSGTAPAPIQMPGREGPAQTPAIISSLTADPAETRALAAAAPTLDALRATMDAYDGCTLKKRATQLCFADGNPEAEIMLVGEGP